MQICYNLFPLQLITYFSDLVTLQNNPEGENIYIHIQNIAKSVVTYISMNITVHFTKISRANQFFDRMTL